MTEGQRVIAYAVYNEAERPVRNANIDIELGNAVRDENGVRIRLPVGNIVRIEPFLWMGGLDAATDRAIIESRDIQRILTWSDEPIADHLKIERKTYKEIPTCELKPENLILEFPECVKFIRDWQSSREAVLVSSENNERIVAVVVAYMMSKYRRNFWDIVEAVDRRRYIKLTWIYIRQFRLFEQMNYTIDVNDQEFRLFLFMCFISRIEPRVADNPNLYRIITSAQFLCALKDYLKCLKRAKIYARNIDPFAVNSGQKYLCRKCNYHLFNEIDVIRSFNKNNSIEASNKIECNDIFIAPKRWMDQFVDRKPVLNLYGSIVCRNCSEKLGDYNLSPHGFRCRCAIHCEFSHNPNDCGEIRENKYYCLLFKIDASKCKSSNKCCICFRC